jgi:hypothetical protein
MHWLTRIPLSPMVALWMARLLRLTAVFPLSSLRLVQESTFHDRFTLILSPVSLMTLNLVLTDPYFILKL